MEEKIKGSKSKSFLVTGIIFIALLMIIINVIVHVFNKEEAYPERSLNKKDSVKYTTINISDSLWKDTEFAGEITD